MFYAMAANKIDTRGYEFEHILQDIQTLNERAQRSELDITAVSIHAYAQLLDQYALLPSGASMGDGYGPLVVARAGEGPGADAGDDAVRAWLRGRRVAIPGPMTSSCLALRLFGGESIGDIPHVPFDKIFEAVKDGSTDAGVVIHEGQLTYREEGLEKVVDLGEWWKRVTGLPLPLGGNVVSKKIDRTVRSEIAVILKESIEYGLLHRREGVEHSMPLARGMERDQVDTFIGMYVNDYTLDYGETGRKAIRKFLTEASDAGYIPAPVELEFVEYPV